MSEENPQNEDKVTFLTILYSTICAWFGVQNKRNRKRDFEQGKPGHFILAGIIFAILFVVVVVGVVQIVISTAGHN